MSYFKSSFRADGLESYVSRKRLHPLHLAMSLFEASLSLVGIVVLILLVRYGSFEVAGQKLDQAADQAGVMTDNLKDAISGLIQKKA
jgi:hypothetical protein